MFKRAKLAGVLSVAGVLAVCGALALPSPAPAAASGLVAAGNTVDAVHSSVVFKLQHAKKANFYGMFKDVSGSFELNAEDAAKSSIDVKVKADSVDTRHGGRDNHVKSADFLSAKEFPEITFKSTSVKKTGDKAFEVVGDLTFRGVTKPVTAQVTQTDEGGKAIEAKFQIKRSDFGNKSKAGEGLSDEVDFIVALEGK